MNIDKLINELTIEEKISLLAGTDFFYTNPIPSKCIKAFPMADGPHGLRYQCKNEGAGLAKSYPSTAFPTSATLACSWNVDSARLVGELIAKECKHYGVGLLLGPGINIKRNPLCGRNFEYFSEDPILTAKMAGSQVKGLQDNNVGATIKHFALNNSENYRFLSDSIADTRAIREIYTKQFENIIKEVSPAAIMTSYNKVNGTFVTENKELVQELLRKEFKYDGLIMTDWGAMHDRIDSLEVGIDLEMPGDTKYCRKALIDGIKSNRISIDLIDSSVRRVLNTIDKYTNPIEDVDFISHHDLAMDIAVDSAVLLKNENNILPLSKDDSFIVVGDLFNNMRYQGSGSSMIEPTFLITPKEAFDKLNIKYEYVSDLSNIPISSNKIIFFAGLTDDYETESKDRSNIDLPKEQIETMNKLLTLGKEIIVVLYSGSVVDLSSLSSADSILYMGLPGQNGGSATTKLLFGDASPSGRLSETWINKTEDIPFISEYSNSALEVYKESVYVGYRYYNTFSIPVRYPFGYGLSYTNFTYSNLKVNLSNEIEIEVLVTNAGDFDASEVVQVYVEHSSELFKPKRELKAFTKIKLNSKEGELVKLKISLDDLKYYNTLENRFVLDKGEYIIQIGKNVNDIILSCPIYIDGEDFVNPYNHEVNNLYKDFKNINNELFEKMSGRKIPQINSKKPITIHSRFSDLRLTIPGRFIYNCVMLMPKQKRRKALKIKDKVQRENRLKAAEFLRETLDSNSICGMSMGSGGMLDYNICEAFVHFANCRFIKGIGRLCSPIRVFKLPKKIKNKKD